MVLNQDFREFIRSLNDNQVRYLVAGGYSVAFHGHPRYTNDIDVWIDRSRKNANKITAALEQFGFATLELSVEDFLEPDQVVQLGNPPIRIDLLTSLTGVSFGACYDKRIVVNVEGLEINFIDLDNLRANKKATGRYQDLADLENLES
jgi:predicted nucleotidyltransferase